MPETPHGVRGRTVLVAGATSASGHAATMLAISQPALRIDVFPAAQWCAVQHAAQGAPRQQGQRRGRTTPAHRPTTSAITPRAANATGNEVACAAHPTSTGPASNPA